MEIKKNQMSNKARWLRFVVAVGVLVALASVLYVIGDLSTRSLISRGNEVDEANEAARRSFVRLTGFEMMSYELLKGVQDKKPHTRRVQLDDQTENWLGAIDAERTELAEVVGRYWINCSRLPGFPDGPTAETEFSRFKRWLFPQPYGEALDKLTTKCERFEWIAQSSYQQADLAERWVKRIRAEKWLGDPRCKSS